NSARRSISPLAIASSSAMISSWWRAGSYPLSRHHSVRLARIRRRRSNSAAACAGDICKLIVAQLLRVCFARHLDLATVAPVLGARVLQGEDCARDSRPIRRSEQAALEIEQPLGLREFYGVRKIWVPLHPLIDALAMDAEFGGSRSERKTGRHQLKDFVA